jgi:hypothetical protein
MRLDGGAPWLEVRIGADGRGYTRRNEPMARAEDGRDRS